MRAAQANGCPEFAWAESGKAGFRRDAPEDATLGLFAKKNAHAYNLDHLNNCSWIY